MNAAHRTTDEPGEEHPPEDHRGWPTAAQLADDDAALPGEFDPPQTDADLPEARCGLRSASDAQLAEIGRAHV